MPARPTPRQRAVLEAMRDGGVLNPAAATPRGHDYACRGVKGYISAAMVGRMRNEGWIAQPRGQSWFVITEAGRRAVARSDGGA